MCGFAVAIDWPEAETTVAAADPGHPASRRRHRPDRARRAEHRDGARAGCASSMPSTACSRRFRSTAGSRCRSTARSTITRRCAPNWPLSASVQDRIRHRSAGQCAAGLGLSRARAAQRHVCLRRARSGDRRIPGRARSVRRQAALCHAVGDRASCSARRCGRCSTRCEPATSCCCRPAMRCRARPARASSRRSFRASMRRSTTSPRALDRILREAVRVRLPPGLPVGDPVLRRHRLRRWSRITRGSSARRRRAISSATRTRRISAMPPTMPRRPASTCASCRSIRTATTSSTQIDRRRRGRPNPSSPISSAARSAR